MTKASLTYEGLRTSDLIRT